MIFSESEKIAILSPPISKYFSEIFSPSHINLTHNNPKKDFKSGKRKIKKVGAWDSNARPIS